MKISFFCEAELSKALIQDIEPLSHFFEMLSSRPVEKSFLWWNGENLVWFDQELGALKIDWIHNVADYHRKSHRGKQELICKALGIDKNAHKILDLTLGLAQDAVFLAQRGVQVVGVERSPVLFLLLKEAQRLAWASFDWVANIEILFGQAQEVYRQQKGIDAIYLDPMFPEKKKSALPRKEMRIFRSLVGEDEDAAELLKNILQNTSQRVVVKRPLKAPVLTEKPIHSYEGTTVRYDLYRGQG